MKENQIIPFIFEDCPIRAVEGENGEWGFIAKDVCKALGMKWIGNAANLQSIPDAWKGVWKLHTPGGSQDLIILREPAVYKLAFRSNKESAERFTDFVAGVILPTLSRTNHYEMNQPQPIDPFEYERITRREMADQLKEMAEGNGPNERFELFALSVDVILGKDLWSIVDYLKGVKQSAIASTSTTAAAATTKAEKIFPPDQKKRCPHCGETKLLSEFHPAGDKRKYGVQSWCKRCARKLKQDIAKKRQRQLWLVAGNRNQ